MQLSFAEASKVLKKALPKITHTDKETCYKYSFDGLKISFLPDAVIIPEVHESIAQVLKLANEYRVPVTTRGVGSTLTGGATPIDGGWVLDLHKLNDINIDAAERIVEVSCGAVVKTIQDACAAIGLYYPPDPSSHKWCTIGGNIACNAGGLRCVKYGVTRDYVLGLKGYLADGTYVEWAKPTRKFATGYNIRDLWIGSEGTLGVITSATLKLIPLPKFKRTFQLGFRDESSALKAILKIQESETTPSIMEFIDKLSVKGAQESVGHDFFKGNPDVCVVLLEIDGNEPRALDNEFETVKSWANEQTDLIRIAENDDAAETLWEVRRQCSSAMFKLGNSKLNEDVVVPLRKMPELVQAVSEIRTINGVPIAVFGHAGDGNLHVNIMYNREDMKMLESAQLALKSLMETVISLNGAISGEHGVGLAKTTFFDQQFQDKQIQLMKQIKSVFDPNGILNPSKLWHPFSPWEHQKVDAKLPWDK